MRVMIIGRGGFIGRYLATALGRDGIEVLALSSRDGTGIDASTGLFRVPPEIPPDVKAVVYLAASPFQRSTADTAAHVLSVNTVSAVQAAAAAVRSGASKLIYASTGNVYAPSFTPLRESAPLRRDNWYALSKVHAEEALFLFRDHIDITVVRLFGIYGPGQQDRLVPNLIRAVHSGAPVTIERNPVDPQDLGGLRISLCHVTDAARIISALCTRGGPPILNIASDETLSVRQIATTIGQHIGREPVFNMLPSSRHTDLIADVSLLQRTMQLNFTRFTDGLLEMVRADET